MQQNHKVNPQWTAWPRWLPVAWLAMLFLAGMTGLTWLLFPRWRSDPELTHGFFMPLFTVLLLRQAYTSPGISHRIHSYLADTLAAIACTLGVAALTLAGLYAIAFTPNHSVALFAATLSFVFFGCTVLLTLGTGPSRLVPLNWAAWNAIFLWLLCAPIPPGAYAKLSLALQLAVSKGVIFFLHAIGIPAARHGNIIELVGTSVGVEEACSGIRSLISCLFAGMFLSAYLLRRPLYRLALIAASVPLAFVMNLARSLLLTLLAHKGIAISGAWHDWTGLAVLILTAGMLLTLALWLEGKSADKNCHASVEGAFTQSMPAAPTRTARLWIFGAILTLVGVFTVIYFPREAQTLLQQSTPPDLADLIPEKAEGWDVVSTDDLGVFVATLQTKHLLQRHYLRDTPTGRLQITLYVAYWQAGQSNPSLVALHTPDGCWPAAGWKKLPTDAENVTLSLKQRALPESEYRRFMGENGQIQNVWYWHMYHGRPIQQLDPYKIVDLLSMVLHFGFRPPGEQLFLRVSSNRPWTEIEEEPLLEQLFLRFRQFGL